jgi:type I restriction enzyme, S subunit
MNRADNDYCIGRGLAAILAKAGDADGSFLANAIEQNISYLHRRSQGSTFLAIGSADLYSMPVAAPALPQQQRIAEILTTVDEAIEHTEALIAKTQQIKAGLMHDLFTRGVTADGQLRPPREEAPQLYKESQLGWIPKEWQVVSIQDLVSHLISGAAIRTDEYSSEGVAVVAKGDVTSNKLIDSRALEQFVPRDTVSLKYSRSLADGRHVVISLRDLVPSAPTVGMASHAAGEGEFLLAQGAYGIMLRNEVLKSSLFVEYTRGARFRALMKTIAVGSTQVHVRSTEYLQVLVPRPNDNEQMAIEEKVLALDSLINSLVSDALKLYSSKTGLMNDLLTGRVSGFKEYVDV